MANNPFLEIPRWRLRLALTLLVRQRRALWFGRCQMYEVEKSEAITSYDWTPWGQPRATRDGVETAFHHNFVLVRESGGPVQICKPIEMFVSKGASVEWSPMPWALDGRRPGRVSCSLETSRAFVGEDDRLFTTINGVCEQLFEGVGLNVSNRDRWVAALKTRRTFCEERGIVYRHLVVPEGHAIYSDAIPGAPRLSENRPLLRILAAANAELRAAFVYPLDALTIGREQEETALPHDIHVTGYGAYLIYRALMKSLPIINHETILSPTELRSRTVLVAGDIARAAGLPARRVTTHEPPPIAYKAVVKGLSFKSNQVDVLQGENEKLPRIVIFRTSTSSRLFPYLIRHFSRITSVASLEVFYDLIESERPAVVVSEMPERFFAHNTTHPDLTSCDSAPNDHLDEFEKYTGHTLPLLGSG